jgi:Uma2 family endonuclease
VAERSEPVKVVYAEDLERLTPPNKRSELVRGVMVVREPAGGRHGWIAAGLAGLLTVFVRPRSLGVVFGAETGFRIFSNPDTVRAPDVAFVRHGRVSRPPPAGFPELAPDLAVEVLSPGDRPGEVLAKIGDWLSAGTALVWVVDPDRESVRVYRADGTVAIVGPDGALDGEDVLPGFTCLLRELFRV